MNTTSDRVEAIVNIFKEDINQPLFILQTDLLTFLSNYEEEIKDYYYDQGRDASSEDAYQDGYQDGFSAGYEAGQEDSFSE